MSKEIRATLEENNKQNYSRVKKEMESLLTIEEREDNFAKREIPHNNGTTLWRDGYREGLKVGYHFGATEQKKIDIDKACEWFSKHMIEYVSYNEMDGWDINHKEMHKDFNKAMEE